MSEGRQRLDRFKLVAQAALVWTKAGPNALTRFIEEGQLPGDDDRADVEPYNPDVVKAIVATGKVY